MPRTKKTMNRKTKIWAAVTGGVLALTFIVLILPSSNGAGYPRASSYYYGRAGGWYWYAGSGRIYGRPSVRRGSSGSRASGGGFRGGK